MLPPIEQRLALELAAKPVQVAAAIALLDEGATVPFIARYRKEATGGLDDIQLRLLEERLRYLRELEERRASIIASITEQNKMTPALLDAVTHAEDKTRLEDLYLPYKQKRRTKAQIAIEAGLAPLADGLLADPTINPDEEALKYLKEAFTTGDGNNPGVIDAKAALDGARQILMERFAEDATLLQSLRDYVTEHGVVDSKVVEGKQDEGEKFADYFDYSETISTVPSHRALALLRGRREGILDVTLRLDTEAEKPKWDAPHNPCEGRIAARFGIRCQCRVVEQAVGQVAEAGFQGDLALGAALLLVRQVQVFEAGLGVGEFDVALEGGGEFALLLDAGEDADAPFVEFSQVTQTLFQMTQLGVIEAAGDFFPVSGDEGNGRAFIE